MENVIELFRTSWSNNQEVHVRALAIVACLDQDEVKYFHTPTI
jgi:hypothetical protein